MHLLEVVLLLLSQTGRFEFDVLRIDMASMFGMRIW